MESIHAAVLGVCMGILSVILEYRSNSVADDKMPKTIQEGENFFDVAQRKLLFVTDLDPTFWNHEQIISHLRSAVDRGVKVRIIYDPRVKLGENGTPAIERMILNRQIEAKRAKGNISGHYWVCDSNSVRIDRHDFQDFKAKGKVRWETYDEGLRLADHFSAWWKNLD